MLEVGTATVGVCEVFVRTDARRACHRGVIRRTMGAYCIRGTGTGSNPVEGKGHFFRSCRQLYLSSFSDTQAHTHVHTRVRNNFGRSPHDQTGPNFRARSRSGNGFVYSTWRHHKQWSGTLSSNLSQAPGESDE